MLRRDRTMGSTKQQIERPGGMALLAGRPVGRIGFGAMQLPGRGVFGPPRDRATALAVLRRAVELGVNHIDTARFYGPALLRCAGPGQTEVASSTRDQIAKISSSNATASRLLVGSSTASS